MRKANLILVAAMAAAGMTMATGALLAPAVAVAQSAPKVGAKMAKPLRAAQEALNAKNWDEALARLAEADAIQPQSEYEAFTIDEWTGFALLQKKDYAGAEKAMAEATASGFVPEAELTQRYKVLTQLNYEIKNYPKAVDYGNKALQREPGSKDIVTMVAHSLFLQDDFAGARDFVAKAAAASATPDEQLLLIGLRSSYELKDRAGTMQALESLVRHYPAPKYWADLLNNQLYETKADRDLRALYRLMLDTNTLDKSEEYSEMASGLMTGGFPTEAKKVLERGLAAGAFQGDAQARAQSDLQRARSGADADAQGTARGRRGPRRRQERQRDGRDGQAVLQRRRLCEGGGCVPQGPGQGRPDGHRRRQPAARHGPGARRQGCRCHCGPRCRQGPEVG